MLTHCLELQMFNLNFLIFQKTFKNDFPDLDSEVEFFSGAKGIFWGMSSKTLCLVSAYIYFVLLMLNKNVLILCNR